MSEHDSDSGSQSGRKGFVRDVMRRITPAGGRADDSDLDGGYPGAGGGSHSGGEGGSPPSGGRSESEVERLQDAMQFFGSDSNEFRHESFCL